MSLPISGPGFTSTNPKGDTSFHLGRNILDTPFRQISHDGLSKRKFMLHKSSFPNETVSDEIKLLNYDNFHHVLIGQNIDDIASDIQLLKQKTQVEKEHIFKKK